MPAGGCGVLNPSLLCAHSGIFAMPRHAARGAFGMLAGITAARRENDASTSWIRPSSARPRSDHRWRSLVERGAGSGPVGQASPPSGTARTAWGDPDLQGVWDFSSNTPLNRAEEFGDRLFLTAEEAAARQQDRVAARDRQDNNPGADRRHRYLQPLLDGQSPRDAADVARHRSAERPGAASDARGAAALRRAGGGARSAWTTTRPRRAASWKTSARGACSCAA